MDNKSVFQAMKAYQLAYRKPDSLLTTVVKPRFYGFIPGGVQAVGQFKRALSTIGY